MWYWPMESTVVRTRYQMAATNSSGMVWNVAS